MSNRKLLVVFFIFMIALSLWSEQHLEKVFQQTRSRIRERDFVNGFKDIINQDGDGKYGNLSGFELAKYYLLKRDYEEAANYLKKCSEKYVMERDFWIGKNQFSWGKYTDCIITLDDYIQNSDNYNNVETSYLIIAEAYIKLMQYYKALNTLEELTKGRYLRQQKPLVFYKTGTTYEKVGDYEHAMEFYGKMKIEFPYHPLTFNANDRANEITDKGLLEMETEPITEPEPEPEPELKKEEMPKPKPKPIPKPEPIPEPMPEPIPEPELKGMFLQVGAFIKSHNLTRRVDLLESMGYEVHLDPVQTRDKLLFKVLVGPFPDDKELNLKKSKLNSQGLECFKTVR